MSMASALIILRFGLHDLFRHRRLVLIMALSIAFATGMFLFLQAYRAGLAHEYRELRTDLLVVHDNQSIGDITGSRISSEVANMLTARGVSLLIPEIDSLTGVTVQDITLLRGIDLQQYTRLEPFRMLSGERLMPGDPPRLAMVGTLLASRQHLRTGDMISLRGRQFRIVGIFQNGTYMDNQAWISLGDAQALLGWGQDVSVYIIPDEGILQEGQTLPGNLSVSRKGTSLQTVTGQYQPAFDMMRIVAWVLGAAAALALANILWRLAWLHRFELAILRAVGFPGRSLALYLLVQAAGITLPGLLLGGLFALAVILGVKFTVASFTIVPSLQAADLLPGLGVLGLLMLTGGLLPAWLLSRWNLASLLHSE
jgi:putative ABC transport system permease protein